MHPLLCLTVFLSSFALLAPSAALGEHTPLEEYLPYSAKIITEVASEKGGPVLSQGTSFVLLRLEQGDAVISVSRQGIFRVPVEKTDVRELAGKAKEERGGSPPEMSRMVMFVGNKLLDGGAEWRKMLPVKLAVPFRTWIFLYADAREPAATSAITSAESFYSGLSAEERVQTALIFVEVLGSQEAITRIGQEQKPSFQALPGFLSAGYRKSFAHVTEEDAVPQFVCVNSSGSIIARHLGADPGAEFWAACRQKR